MSHALALLGEIATLQAGFGFPPNLQGRATGQIPFAKVGDISRGGRSESSILSKADHYVDAIDVTALRAKIVPPGSVLFAKIGEAIRQNHRVVAGCEMLIDNNAMAAIPGARVDSRYLYHFLKTVDFYCLAPATTVPALRKSDLEKLQVPLPPLPDQRRIATILDQADAIRALRRKALAQLDSLSQSIFIEMFGDRNSSRSAWKIKRLDELTECLDRWRRPVTESDRKPGAIPYYGANGQQGWIDAHLFDEPLVLVAEDGGHFNNPSRGVAYRVDGKCWVNNHAHILRPKKDVLDVEYLHRALRHFDFTPYVSGTTRAKLTQGQLNCIRLMVPPIAVQHVFADRIRRNERMLNLFRESMKQLDALFASLQHRAFSGEVP